MISGVHVLIGRDNVGVCTGYHIQCTHTMYMYMYKLLMMTFEPLEITVQMSPLAIIACLHGGEPGAEVTCIHTQYIASWFVNEPTTQYSVL